MPIKFHKTTKIFHLYNQEISYIFKILKNNQLGQLYYGKAIKDRENFDHLFETMQRPMASCAFEGDLTFSLEHIKQEYPAYGSGDMRHPAIEIAQANGSRIISFNYQGHTIISGKPKLDKLPATYVESPDEATTLLNQLKQAEEAALANKTEQAPTVAIIFGAGDNFMLATESSYLGDLAKTLGAINIASEIDTNIESAYIQFSLEQILAQNPDYVLRFAHGNIEETSKMFDEAFDKNEAYQQLDAVADGKVYDLDSTIFNVSANLKVTEAITKLGEILYGN